MANSIWCSHCVVISTIFPQQAKSTQYDEMISQNPNARKGYCNESITQCNTQKITYCCVKLLELKLAIWCLRPLGHLSAQEKAIVQHRSPARKPDKPARENQAQKQETASGDLPVAFSENEVSVSFVPFATRFEIRVALHANASLRKCVLDGFIG